MATHLGSLIIENDLTVRDLFKLAAFSTPGEYLTVIDAEGTVGTVNSPQINRRAIALADYGTGTIQGDWNAQTPTITVGPLDLITVTWAMDSTDYLFMGTDGIYGSGGVDTATAGDFFQFSGAGSSNEFLDTVFRVLNGTDLTKQIAFNAASIAPGQTRTITMPDFDVDLGDLPQPPLSGSGDPNTVVNPRYIGDIFIDTSFLHVWVATSVVNTSWKRNDNAKTTIAALPPTANDDKAAGYEPFSLWLDSALSQLYMCEDQSVGAAVWLLISGGAGNTEVSNDIKATITVGAINSGDIVVQGTDLTGFVAQLIAPTIIPTKTNNSNNVNGISTATKEVGELYTATLVASYNTGTIYSKDGSPNVPLTGAATGSVYSGPGVNTGTGAVSTTLGLGMHVWSAVTDFAAETAAYYDSTGASSTIFDALRGPSPGTTPSATDNSSIITGKYRYWWDIINTPNDSAGVRSLGSAQRGWMSSTNFTITVPDLVNDIAVYIKADYNSFKVEHIENFDLDITSLFFSGTITINDAAGNPVQYVKMATNTSTFAGFAGVNNFKVIIT